MITEDVREILHAAPFVPFTIFLANGRTFRIEHPDFVLLPRIGHVMVISLENGAFAHIDLLLATHLETDATGAAAL